MSEAGLFSATVTESAPANGADTVKENGHLWMEHDPPVPPPP